MIGAKSLAKSVICIYKRYTCAVGGSLVSCGVSNVDGAFKSVSFDNKSNIISLGQTRTTEAFNIGKKGSDIKGLHKAFYISASAIGNYEKLIAFGKPPQGV